ncbi:DNA-binding PadR family transcriptional regulator [Conexibacter arvalis]|uniref:DNA-binding PadR family transcriptional regulator n=1 Tax=Conexibacter arvalis TaxID=912552 RepID=A0A840IEV3_9ACTN|nr:helix-turn-helix transcriptional regulator [Conexibacter arvalis]MBB4662733.1 DNA-binding PadR family transcriptional regulator [Conexibacter arvalis]
MAVLGLVIERPSYGYELSRRLQTRFGDLLAVSRSHVYGALDALQRGGLIEPLPAPPAAEPVRQPKVHYRATAAGERAFAAWVVEELGEHARRARLLGAVAELGGGRDEEAAGAIAALVASYERAWERFGPVVNGR